MTTPAASCFHCHTPGTLSEDQTSIQNSDTTNKYRFYCTRCLRVWLTQREDAELTGRFWDRAGLR